MTKYLTLSIVMIIALVMVIASLRQSSIKNTNKKLPQKKEVEASNNSSFPFTIYNPTAKDKKNEKTGEQDIEKQKNNLGENYKKSFIVTDLEGKPVLGVEFNKDYQSEQKREMVYVDTYKYTHNLENVRISEVAEQEYEDLQVIFDIASSSYEVTGFVNEKINLIITHPHFCPHIIPYELLINIENNLKVKLEPLYRLRFKLNTVDQNIKITEKNGAIFLFGPGLKSWKQKLIYNKIENEYEALIDLQECNSFSLKFPQYLPTPKTILQRNSTGFAKYEFSLIKGFGFRGAIIDSSGNPIEDSDIEILTPEEDNYSNFGGISNEEINKENNDEKVIMDNHGKFYTYGYFSGDYILKVKHPEFIKYEVKIKLTGNTDLSIVLKKNAMISGTVFDYEETPKAGAKISLLALPKSAELTYIAYSEKEKFEVWSDAIGKFEINHIPSGKYQMVVYGSAGYYFNPELEIIEDKEISNLSIRLQKYLTIEGKVINEKNEPVPHTTIFANNVDHFLPEESTMTDENGFFQFSTIVKGTYHIDLVSSKDDNLNFETPNRYYLDTPVTAKGGYTTVIVSLKTKAKEIELTKSKEPEISKSLLIRGRVFSPEGKEVSDYDVSVSNNNNSYCGTVESKDIGFSGCLGSFNPAILTNSPSGFCILVSIINKDLIKVIAKAPGYSAGESEAFNPTTYNDEIIPVILKTKICSEVRILDKINRQPICNAEAKLFAKADSLYNNLFSGLKPSDKNGLIQFEELFPGEYLLVVRAPGFAMQLMNVHIEKINAIKEILMGKGGSIKGKIFDDHNNPQSFMPVFIKMAQEKDDDITYYDYRNDGCELITTMTDENGSYEFTQVPNGRCFVSTKSVSNIQATDFFKGIPVIVEEGKETIITYEEYISSTLGAKVNITVKGLITRKMTISFFIIDESTNSAIEDSFLTNLETSIDGKLTIPHLPFGKYKMKTASRAKTIETFLIVGNQKEINIEITIE